MIDDDRSTRAELLRLTPSGDLLDLARGMRDMGVESLLFCSPSGRIQQVVTDRQIAHLAASAEDDGTEALPRQSVGSAPVQPVAERPVGPAIPRQTAEQVRGRSNLPARLAGP